MMRKIKVPQTPSIHNDPVTTERYYDSPQTSPRIDHKPLSYRDLIFKSPTTQKKKFAPPKPVQITGLNEIMNLNKACEFRFRKLLQKTRQAFQASRTFDQKKYYFRILSSQLRWQIEYNDHQSRTFRLQKVFEKFVMALVKKRQMKQKFEFFT